MASQNMLRICREIADIQKGTDLSIAVASQESDMRQVQALIGGPPGTPYQYGFFEFSVKFGSDYPSKPPKVEAKTTNFGRCRFNPNIYANGKVCLSILGTWPGNEGEQWSAAQGLESVLLSIQSLMSSNPYENEPGYEGSRNEIDMEAREAYCAKIYHETLRIAVIDKLERITGLQQPNTESKQGKADTRIHPGIESEDKHIKGMEEVLDGRPSNDPPPKFEPFNDLLKQRFLWYYDNFMDVVDANEPKYASGTVFQCMPFEMSGNGMMGKFEYSKLRRRLLRIKEALQKEVQDWMEEGHRANQDDLNIAYNLRTQFDQFALYQQQRNINNVDVSLLEDNPFVWMLTYFGRSGSNLDGGVFRIRLSISPRFPEEQPRVRFETRMYHHRVSKEGTLCYFPTRTDEVKYHIEAIILALEEISPPYDPRAIVHPEATRLFWGDDGDKKKYSRAQRRSAEDSLVE